MFGVAGGSKQPLKSVSHHEVIKTKKRGGLKFLGEFFELGDGEDRSINADILGADVAASTFSDATLHAHL